MWANAEAEVIYDSGQTEPIAPFLTPLEKIESAARTPRSRQNAARDTIRTRIKALFPLETSEMQPGLLGSHVMDDTWRQRFAISAGAFFLLGTDPLSRQWLQDNRAALIERKAIGIVVEAKNLAEVHTLQQLGEGLQIVPLPGRAFYEQLGITRYPVLISKDGFEQ